MKKLILAMMFLASVAHGSEYDVDKVCQVGNKEIRFEYKVSSIEPEMPAVVTVNGIRFEGLAQDSVAVMFPMYVGYFEFAGGTVTSSSLYKDRKYWLGTGQCS